MKNELPKRLTKPEREEMCRIIVEFLGPKKALLWWQAENPMFGGVAPFYMMQMGLERKVYQFVMDAHEANTTPPAGGKNDL